jgi:hypothetical protein
MMPVAQRKVGSGPVDPEDLIDPTRRTEHELALAFAPLHKRNFGIAVGLAFGLLIFLATLIYLLRDGAEQFDLGLLGNYFFGYRPTVPGAFIGLGWGFVTGFVAGWFVAFLRNFAVGISVFLIRTRAELNETRDFLDHI